MLVRTCPSLAAGLPKPGVPPLSRQVALSHQLRQLVTCQPPNHYWPLQALETGIFLAAAFALIGATVWWVGSRAARKPALGEMPERTADPLALLTERN